MKRCIYEFSGPADLHFRMAVLLLRLLQVPHGALRVFNGFKVVLSVRDVVILNDGAWRSVARSSAGHKFLQMCR